MTRVLYLAWQDKHDGSAYGKPSRQWFPVGRLDVDKDSGYRFRYIKGAIAAQEQAGFQPLDAFPELEKDYRSRYLFSLFRNRVPSPERGDYQNMLKRLDLPSGADPFEILAVSGGARQTDNLEVFPRIEKRPDGGFVCRFFLHGWRYVNESSKERLMQLQKDDALQVSVELNNPATGIALQLQTSNDYHMLGWAPRYLISDLLTAITEAPQNLYSRVVQVNPPPAPHNQRLLLEFGGYLPEKIEPMSDQQFDPLVA